MHSRWGHTMVGGKIGASLEQFLCECECVSVIFTVSLVSRSSCGCVSCWSHVGALVTFGYLLWSWDWSWQSVACVLY